MKWKAWGAPDIYYEEKACHELWSLIYVIYYFRILNLNMPTQLLEPSGNHIHSINDDKDFIVKDIIKHPHPYQESWLTKSLSSSDR